MSKGSARRKENHRRVTENLGKVRFSRCKCGSYRVEDDLAGRFVCLSCGHAWNKSANDGQ